MPPKQLRMPLPKHRTQRKQYQIPQKQLLMPLPKHRTPQKKDLPGRKMSLKLYSMHRYRTKKEDFLDNDKERNIPRRILDTGVNPKNSRTVDKNEEKWV